MNVQQRQERRRRVERRAQGLRQERRVARKAKAQAGFVGPYTPKQAAKVARSQTKTEYAPLERQIASEIRGSKKREGELGDWYSGLAGDYAQGQQAAQQAFTTAEQATNDRLGAQAQSYQQAMQGVGAADSSFAALTGAPNTGAAIPDEAAVAAAAERTRAALQAPVTEMRAANVASYTPRRNAAALQGIEARGEEAARRRTKQQDLRSLKQEHGQAMVKNLQTLREQDQNFTTQQQALGAKVGYNRAIEKQAQAGVTQAKVTAAATVAAAQAYSKAKERGASAQEAAAQAYSAAKRRGANAQEAVAAENRAASEYKARSNENVAKQQGRNAASGGGGGYTISEGVSLLKSALDTRGFRTPGEMVDYLVNRGVKRSVAKQAAGRVWRVERGAGG